MRLSFLACAALVSIGCRSAATGANAALEARALELTAEIDDLTVEVIAYRSALGLPEDWFASARMPSIDGAVITVDAEVITVDQGRLDGVEPGFTFEVYFGGTYKGRVRVDEVAGATCRCSIVETYGGRAIQVGDKASTRL